MKNLFMNKWMLSAAVVAASFTASNAQLSLGTSCGCPPLASRTSVDLSTLAQANGNLTSTNTTLTCNNTYNLNLKLYVQSGAKLNIQAGTVIRGVFGEGVNSNALIVSRGGQIFAMGGEDCPIIFTDANDPLDGSYSVNIRGQWGGVIVLGRATNNLLQANGGLAVGDGVGTIEGLLVGDPRNTYGETVASGLRNDNDNSGIMRYVSIRHGGTNIGANNEINGLTLGSVGRGTSFEYIEVIANDDDGIEFFGGTVDMKYATVFAVNDDYFDFDHGYTGRGQFWFGVQLQGAAPQGDEGFEADGDDSNSGNQPFTSPNIYNTTLIGRGANRGVEAREGFQGRIANSIFTNFTVGIELTDEAGRVDAFDNYNAGTLIITNNIFAGVTSILTVNAAAPAPATAATFAADGNTVQNNVIDFNYTINIANNVITNAYNPVPAVGSVNTTSLPPVDDFFCGANYKGAFQPGKAPWTSGWTLAAVLGVDNSLANCPEDINSDGQINVNDFLELNNAFNTSCGL